ncbi:hypothetical protein TWF225_001812 [Orbilia oligospora]|uniref:CFEM domain-containing protein n=1 Tax=Orbilia oligospora TaxID=2813651 RepID=A0A7C8JX69_ORBOL|nr:hypothetical protein TWF751_002124 [Orbilia oligospora]KAF3190844.1 hypothetical protein TWF225_001812 [Orbilia oligospora]KAF3262307.1 hypothetical protein TWF217_004373 [Orbilia oligospora]KAF3265195.1 hypothetical protein TWF128_000483 [Orbilia oligospora]TGJ70612.1 hypothetical protein EYR41_002647 [Orbilia oligospora]
MKTSGILAVAAGAALAAAQLDQIPTCALTCAITSLGSTGCSQTDIACICKASSFLTGILSCIQGSCTPAEIEQTLGAAQGLCASAGVTITVPGSDPTTAAPEPTTAAPEPEPTTTEELTTAPGLSTTSAAEPEPTSTEEPSYEPSTEVPAPTYGASTTSDVVTLTTTTTICPSSTHEVPTYVPPPAQNTTVAVPPPAYTGAAGNIVANAGTVLIGAALAMFFA